MLRIPNNVSVRGCKNIFLVKRKINKSMQKKAKYKKVRKPLFVHLSHQIGDWKTSLSLTLSSTLQSGQHGGHAFCKWFFSNFQKETEILIPLFCDMFSMLNISRKIIITFHLHDRLQNLDAHDFQTGIRHGLDYTWVRGILWIHGNHRKWDNL